MACDHKYFWGTFILTASMRMNGMDEPVLIYQTGFTNEMREALKKLGDVEFYDAPNSKLNMTCRKPDAMLAAKNEYIAWIDCDAYFVGNCSSLLHSPEPDTITIRQRTIAENIAIFNNMRLYGPEDSNGSIPQKVLDVWRRDVNESQTPHLNKCVSACAFTIHSSQRHFLELWREQMLKVLPGKDTGVTANVMSAYYQLDESVLNSLLCFMENPPQMSPFMLDQDGKTMYWHMVNTPKPWQWWSRYSLMYYRDIMKIIAWAEENGLLPDKLPFALNRKYEWFHKHLTSWCLAIRIRRKIKHVLGV